MKPTSQMNLLSTTVRTFLVPEKEQESMPKDRVSGGKCSGSFAWYDQSTCLWRTWQRCLTGGLMKYLGRWPKAGMMRNGHASELPTLEHHTEESESSLWPTPRASDAHRTRFSLETTRKVLRKRLFGPLEKRSGPPLGEVYADITGNSMRAEHVEWMMGFPEDYTKTDLEA